MLGHASASGWASLAGGGRRAARLLRRHLPVGRRSKNVVANKLFLQCVGELKRSAENGIRVAEIGVDRGATTVPLVRMLDSADTLDLYDRASCHLAKNQKALLETATCKANLSWNTERRSDSYAWTIARDILEREAQRSEGRERRQFPIIWDAVYLDGAHDFVIDGTTVCLIKEVIRVGGYLVLDDLNWSFARSAGANNRSNRGRYTTDQMTRPHVRLVAELFMEHDPRYLRVNPENHAVGVYRRIG